MMNNIIKCGLIFATGVGVGFITSNLILKNHYISIMNEKIEKEAIEDSDCKGKEKGDEIDGEGGNFNQGENEHFKSSLEGTYTGSYNKTIYSYGASAITGDETEEEFLESSYIYDDHGDEEMIPDKDPHRFEETGNQEPYVITSVDFDDTCTHFDKITLYYYTFDDVLIDDHDYIIEDYEEVTGTEAIAKLEMQSSIYVRNERLESDYEVIRLEQSYYEDVLGVRKEKPHNKRELKPHEEE